MAMSVEFAFIFRTLACRGFPIPGRKIGKELASAKLAIASTIEGIRNLQSSQNSMLTTQR
jgi:hypothetical protein